MMSKVESAQLGVKFWCLEMRVLLKIRIGLDAKPLSVEKFSHDLQGNQGCGMKSKLNNLLLPKLLICFGLLWSVPLIAQSFTVLHNFTDLILNNYLNTRTNSDGAFPESRLVSSGQSLFGMCEYGGNEGSGSIFGINTDGTNFTNLYSFTENAYPYPINNDGANPVSELMLSGDVLYGTASEGGNSNYQPYGTIFAIKTNGTEFVNLHTFAGGSDGANPAAGLILSGNTLYGTTINGGNSGDGTLFAVNINGTGFTNLYSFNWTNDGAHPMGRLLLMGDSLYGTTQNGGVAGYGIVFKVCTNGTSFETLHDFVAGDDGAEPEAGLIVSSNILYGTTSNYGSLGGYGTVFALHTDGTGYTNLHSFTADRASPDGAFPYSELVLSGDTLYGTTDKGGVSDDGTIFAVKIYGTEFTNLHSFNANIDGGEPFGGLILSGNTLYGTTSGGGSSGTGTIFKFSLEAVPQLTIATSGKSVILTWSTNATGFALQAAPEIGGVFTNIAGAMSPYTNPILSGQMFFRLSR